jgi:hypothetical protein
MSDRTTIEFPEALAPVYIEVWYKGELNRKGSTSVTPVTLLLPAPIEECEIHLYPKDGGGKRIGPGYNWTPEGVNPMQPENTDAPGQDPAVAARVKAEAETKAREAAEKAEAADKARQEAADRIEAEDKAREEAAAEEAAAEAARQAAEEARAKVDAEVAAAEEAARVEAESQADVQVERAMPFETEDVDESVDRPSMPETEGRPYPDGDPPRFIEPNEESAE